MKTRSQEGKKENDIGLRHTSGSKAHLCLAGSVEEDTNHLVSLVGSAKSQKMELSTLGLDSGGFEILTDL
jgi:hypothetical protein